MIEKAGLRRHKAPVLLLQVAICKLVRDFSRPNVTALWDDSAFNQLSALPPRQRERFAWLATCLLSTKLATCFKKRGQRSKRISLAQGSVAQRLPIPFQPLLRQEQRLAQRVRRVLPRNRNSMNHFPRRR